MIIRKFPPPPLARQTMTATHLKNSSLRIGILGCANIAKQFVRDVAQTMTRRQDHQRRQFFRRALKPPQKALIISTRWR